MTAPGGRAYTRTVIADASGVPHVEHWAIEDWGTLGLGAARTVHTQISMARRFTRNAAVLFGDPTQPPTS